MPHRNPHHPLVLTCSGASDVGELADRVGRRLVHQHAARLECAAAVASHLPVALEHLQQAKTVLAIDGCASHCLSKILHRAGMEKFHHLELGELGFAKGHAPATEDNIHRATEAARVLLEG